MALLAMARKKSRFLSFRLFFASKRPNTKQKRNSLGTLRYNIALTRNSLDILVQETED